MLESSSLYDKWYITHVLPPIVNANIQSVVRMVRSGDWDWHIVVYGKPRVGKTVLSALIMLDAEPELDRQIRCADYTEALARHVWTFDDYCDAVRTCAPGSVIPYQESVMLGREALKKWNIDMIRVVSAYGYKNIIPVLTFPRFQMLDPFLRYRAATKVHVRTRNRERGYARWYYSRESTPMDNTDEPNVFIPAFDSRFRDIRTFSAEHAEYWAQVREKERAVKDGILARHGRREESD